MTHFSNCVADPVFANTLYPAAYLDGIVFGVSACPEIPMPMQWIPWLVKSPAESITESHLAKLSDSAIKALQDTLAAMRDNQPLLPSYCSFEQSQSLSQWCHGVLYAHQQLEDVWQQAWDNMQRQNADMMPLQKRLKRSLSLISTFADIELAQAQAKQRNSDQFDEKLPQLFQSLESNLADYVALSGTLASYLENQFETFTQPQSQHD